MGFVFIAAVFAIGGVVAGGVVAWLMAERKFRGAAGELVTGRAVAEERAEAVGRELEEARRRGEGLAGEVEARGRELAGAQAQAAGLAAQLAGSEKNILEQKKLLEEAQQKLTEAFAAVSQNALERSNAVFIQMAEAKFKTLSAESAGSLDERKAQIATLLKPLEEALAGYQKRLAETEGSRTNAYGELLKQIGSMSATQQTLTVQTTQLASALKKSHVRGRWGEIALQRLAEMAGMTEHVDFAQQESLRDGEGRVLRPDMVVKLPGERCVVVDAKAVMNAFLDAMGVSEEGARGVLMQAHARNVRSRVDDLAGKAYWNQFETAPEFVVLFLPGESFLYGACEADAGLIEYAISQRVILATPTTFIGLLQTIEHGWRQQALSANAEAIRTLGTEIYDRVATLAENMMRLGKSLDGAVEQYNRTVGTLETRVLVSARKIGEMGARTEKEMVEVLPVEKRSREMSGVVQSERSGLLGE